MKKYKYETRKENGFFSVVRAFYNRFNGSLEKERHIDIFDSQEDADRAVSQLEANKKKTVTKSKFPQRLEAAAKQRGYNSSKK